MRARPLAGKVPNPTGDAVTLKATGEETGSWIGFLVASRVPETWALRHIHPGRDELLYVLDGEFLFLFGERQTSVPPGTFVFIPRETVQAAKVVGIEPGKMLAVYITGVWSGPSRSSPMYEPRRSGSRHDCIRHKQDASIPDAH